MTSTEDLFKMAVIYKTRLDDILYLNDFISAPKIGNFIINLDLSNTGGTHWVALINLKDKIFYFDPFGIIDAEIKNKIEYSLQKPLIYNNVKIQNINEKICGPLSLAFLKEAEKIKTEKQFNDAIKEVLKYKVVWPSTKK
jgi:hypothetical protein